MKKNELLKKEMQKSRGLRLSEGTAKKPLIIDIPLEEIEAKEQVRTLIKEDSEELQELAQSMKEMGLLQPILVYPTKEKKFVIIAGHRRVAAARLLGWKTIRAIVKNPPLKEEKHVLQLIENLQREDLSPIDEALAYYKLHNKMGLSFGDIAKKIGKNRARIANVYKIVDLILKCFAGETLTPESIQKAREELTGLSRGVLEDLAYIVNEEYFQEALSLAKSGATREELRRFIEKKKREKQGEEGQEKPKNLLGEIRFLTEDVVVKYKRIEKAQAENLGRKIIDEIKSKIQKDLRGVKIKKIVVYLDSEK